MSAVHHHEEPGRPEQGAANLDAAELHTHGCTTVSVEALANRIETFPRRLWLLDYDGTLAPIVSQPENALPEARALDALVALSRRESDVLAIVSGRSVAQLVAFLGPLTSEKAFFCGLHGGEIVEWPSGKALLEPDPALRAKLASFETALVANLAANGLESRGISLENKTFSLAMHYRNAADADAAHEAIGAFHKASIECKALGDFAIRPGKMVLELVPGTFEKGRAASFLLDRSRDERGVPAHPISAGDDITDEHAFEAVLRENPDATVIRIGKEERPSGARYRLDSPSDMVEVLARVTGLLRS